MININNEREIEREKQKKEIEQKMGFFTHLLIFVLVNGFIILPENGIFGSESMSLPTIGWGIGLAMHFLKTFVFNNAYIDRKVDQNIDRM